MEQADLKAAQAPLKERYRAEPKAARVTLRAEGRLGEAEVSCRVDTGRALVEAGLPPATGGGGRPACAREKLPPGLWGGGRRHPFGGAAGPRPRGPGGGGAGGGVPLWG